VIVRGGTVVTARGVEHADVAIRDGRITDVGPDVERDGAEEIDATGLHVFPGGIDSHVHFNEPGRTEWEDIAHGSAALATGGYTSFVDMPLNGLPVTTTVEAFDLKVAAMTRSSKVDFGLWGGLVPGNLDQLEPLVRRGVLGFKAFMCPSGIEEFPACDKRALREGMLRIAELGSILLVHAEDPSELREPTGPSGRDFVASRPARAELAAITVAIETAGASGCPLHVVHVSTAQGAELIEAARRLGADVSCETCPHYLLYTEADTERLGGIAKCAPPFRTAADRERLLGVPMVVSDHSPSTLELKQGDDFRRIWGGISGCQSTRQLLLANGRLDLQTIAAVTATNIAKRFGVMNKGDVAPGFDADLWIVDLDWEGVVRSEDLLYRNPFSVHEGQAIRGRTVRTLVRGRTVFVDGKPSSRGTGRLVRTARAGDRRR
jgi:allantoinase